MRLLLNLIATAVTGIQTFVSSPAQAASAIGTATQTIIPAIAIQPVSDLNFGSAAQGDASKTILAGTSETSENASFEVTGEPNRAYSVILPANGVVQMTTKGGGIPQRKIAINSFMSYPSSTGMIPPSGKQSLFIGATRDAILPDQVTGSYVGNFVVTVVY